MRGGNLGGRSNVARSINPPRAWPKQPAAQIGAGQCFCACTGAAATGRNYGGGTLSSPFAGGEIRDITAPCACDVSQGISYDECRGELVSSDMAAELTIVTWWDSNPGAPTYSEGAYAELVCRTRRDDPPSSYGYSLLLSGNYSTRTSGGALLTVTPHAGGGTTTLGTIGSGINLVDGGLLELSTIGTAIVARWNGSTLFSVTDSTIGEWVNPGTDTEPAQYASYRHGASGNTTCTVDGFAVTPTCP